MDEYASLSHPKWECKQHVAFIPKGRRKALYGHLRQHLGGAFRRLAQQKESRIEEGHLMVDHVHMMLSIPPKCAVSVRAPNSPLRAAVTAPRPGRPPLRPHPSRSLPPNRLIVAPPVTPGR